MFPNDDICNVEAARRAARRLFHKYRAPLSKEEEGGSETSIQLPAVMGKDEVNRLMKATYQAIQMPYDPNEEDVFSFIDVFDSNHDGKIELKDIEDMAVKYLCGESALQLMQKAATGKEETTPLQTPNLTPLKQSEQKFNQTEPTQNSPENSRMNEEQKPKKELSSICSYTPKKPQNLQIYSPKSRPPSSIIPTQNRMCSPTNLSSSFTRQPQPMQTRMAQARKIYNANINPETKTISQKQAGNLLTETYRMLNRKYIPSAEDVSTWMKLCDSGHKNTVEWSDYEYFVRRTIQRQTQK